MTNIRDVAKLAKVSMSTVSRVLNNYDIVSKENKERVLEAIEALHYRPNGLARGLINGRTQTIGVLIPDISNYFYAEVVRGIEETAYGKGWNVIICNTAREESKILNYINILGEKRVDGIIFTSRPVNEKLQDAFQTIGVPVILLATESRYQIPAVKINDEQASFDAVTYLIEKGHRRIGMIAGPLEDPIAGAPRISGFFKALEAARIEYTKDSVFYGNFRFESGRMGAEALLGRFPDLTALFVASDEAAFGVYSYSYEHGINIPKDLSIIGFNNVKASYMCTPPLTTVEQPQYRMGEHAALQLIQMINGVTVEPRIDYMQHRIIERESVFAV